MTNTVAQQETATKNRSPLNQAAKRPTTRAAIPDQILSVAITIAGKVMTASVTYGTYYRKERSQTLGISFLNTGKGSILMQYTVRHIISSDR